MTLHAQYVWSPVYVNALVLRDYDFNAAGAFNIKDRVYALQDANFTTNRWYIISVPTIGLAYHF